MLEFARDGLDLPVDELADERDDGGFFFGKTVHRLAFLHVAIIAA